MKNFGIRFGRSNVAEIAHFEKKRPILNTLAACSLLLMASSTIAAPQTQAVSGSSTAKPNPEFSKWAAPSPSCFSRSACMADTNFQLEFTGFVNFIHSRYPTAQVPTAQRLQRHACRMLAPAGTHTPDDLDVDDVAGVSMGQWLTTYLSYSLWSTQPGLTPYQTAPVWWCFLDNSTRYVVTDLVEVNGATDIINKFGGLAKPVASGGEGYYVSQLMITDMYPAISLDPGFFAAQTYTNKELVAIDAAAPGTTKRLAQYQSFMKVQEHNSYPLRTISFIQETVNPLTTVQWLGLCSAVCIDCAPGTVCP